MGVADADEVERHAHLGGILRRLGQVLALRGHAVGEHDDGGQRRAAIIVDAPGGRRHRAGWRRGGDRPSVPGSRPLPAARSSDGRHLGQLGGPGRAMVDVDLDLAPLDEMGQPVQVAARGQGLEQVQTLQVGSVLGFLQQVGVGVELPGLVLEATGPPEAGAALSGSGVPAFSFSCACSSFLRPRARLSEARRPASPARLSAASRTSGSV